MSLVELLLDDSEINWRDVIRTEAPPFANMPVLKAKPDPKNKRHWMFYTDLEKIHMDVFKPDVVEKLFNGIIKDMYEKAYNTTIPTKESLVSRLIHDNFFYLYTHEVLHPWKCPDSKTDEKNVDKALYKGIQRGVPSSSRIDVLNKVGNCRNAGWDQVIDGAFYYMTNNPGSFDRRLRDILHDARIESNNINYLPDGVISIFDVMEFEIESKKFDSMFYPLSRAIYGLMFTKSSDMRSIIFDYFKNKTTKQMREDEFDTAVKSALKGVVSRLDGDQLKYARIEKTIFENDIDNMYKNYKNSQYDTLHSKVVNTIIELLMDKNSRYEAIEGFIEPLAKYISLAKEEKRHGTHIGQGQGSGSGNGQGQGQSQQSQNGNGSGGNGQQNDMTGQNQPGGNTEQALLNLSDVLGQQEGNALLSEIANSSMGGGAGGSGRPNPRLHNLATDEYYKRNAKEIVIKSPNYEAVQYSLGKKRIPEHVSSIILLPQEVMDLNLEKIIKFQEETGITQLYQLSSGQYRLDNYEWKEVDDTDYKYENKGIDLPENVVLHNDSSISMGGPNFVGTGSQYDTLMHVDYGILKTLKKASIEMSKPVNIITVNFSNGTIVSNASDLVQMYDTPNNNTKTVLTGYQNGGTTYNVKAFDQINKMLKPGKTMHIWTTDGELNSGYEEPVFKRIEKETQNPNVNFHYFEIGSESSFGRRIQQLEGQGNVQSHMNMTIEAIKNSAVEILIQYNNRYFRK